MLVEDDKSLREIYGVRLLAEGYDIVSAGDGEEALAMAIKERPKLIVTDVMMPKISGFDMLDILRSTTETKDIKVIMMTALSSDDQRARGEQMGADRYLVKSQVGIEDVVRVVHEVLGDANAKPSAPAATPPTAAPAASIPPRQAPTPQPFTPLPRTVNPPVTAPPPRAPVPPASAATATTPVAPAPSAVQFHQMPPSSTAPSPPSAKQRIIQPLNNTAPKVDINALLDKELARESSAASGGAPPQVPTTAQEKAVVQDQIEDFGGKAQTPQSPPVPERPAVQVPNRPPRPPQSPQAPTA